MTTRNNTSNARASCAILTAARNEARALPHLVQDLPAGFDLYLVDDGSTDGTSEIAERSGFRVIRHPVTLGQGYAMLTGMQAILERTDVQYEYIVCLDADGQHDPREITRFLEKAGAEGLDVVVGSRVLGSNHDQAPYFRRAFLPVITKAINALTGYDLTDAMCGYRAFRVQALRRIQTVLDNMLEPQYLAAEMFLRFARAGLKIGEVPVTLRNRAHGTSHKGFFRYGYGIAKAIVNTLIDRNYRGHQT